MFPEIVPLNTTWIEFVPCPETIVPEVTSQLYVKIFGFNGTLKVAVAPWQIVEIAGEIEPKEATVQLIAKVTLSETEVVLQAPTPVAVKVKISVLQILAKDWYIVLVPNEKRPAPLVVQLWELALVTLVPVIVNGAIGWPAV